MALHTMHGLQTPVLRSAGWLERPRVATIPLVASGLSGLAIAFVVGADDAILWRFVRVAAVGALTWAALRTDLRPQRLAQFVLAIVATATGAGIGFPHVAKGGCPSSPSPCGWTSACCWRNAAGAITSRSCDTGRFASTPASTLAS